MTERALLLSLAERTMTCLFRLREHAEAARPLLQVERRELLSVRRACHNFETLVAEITAAGGNPAAIGPIALRDVLTLVPALRATIDTHQSAVISGTIGADGMPSFNAEMPEDAERALADALDALIAAFD